jgi:hypothetical protein
MVCYVKVRDQLAGFCFCFIRLFFFVFLFVFLLVFFLTDLKTSLNNFISVNLTVISPHHRRLCFYFWTSYPWYLLRVLFSLVGKKDGSLLPVYFQGQMSFDFLQDLICTCKGKAVCSSG